MVLLSLGNPAANLPNKPCKGHQKLSERRAIAVKNWLAANGIAAERLEEIGYGEAKPKYDNKTDEGRKLNRRVEIQPR